MANIVLRPLAHKIDKTPNTVTEEEFLYCISVTCRHECEIAVRTSLLQAVSSEHLTLYSLHSEDTAEGTKVMVEAKLVSSIGCQDNAVEKIISTISLETGVISVCWRRNTQS